MKRLNVLTNAPKQKFQVVLDDGTAAQFYFEYRPLQLGWFMTLTYKSFLLSLIRVTAGQNILAQFSNLLPFGLACLTTDGFEPLTSEEFSGGHAELYLLDRTDLAALEAYLGAKV